MKQNNQLIVLTHLSQLITLVTGFGSLLVPLIIWLTQKETVYQMDAHGKNIINFQLSLIIYCIICIPLILFFGLGILGFIALGIISVVFPIVNAVKASNGEVQTYPFTLNIISLSIFWSYPIGSGLKFIHSVVEGLQVLAIGSLWAFIHAFLFYIKEFMNINVSLQSLTDVLARFF
jgi:uncharacterized protein